MVLRQKRKRSVQWFQSEKTIVSNLEREREVEKVRGKRERERERWERTQIHASTHPAHSQIKTLRIFSCISPPPPPVQLPPPPPNPCLRVLLVMCSGSGKREAGWGNQRCKCFVQRLGNNYITWNVELSWTLLWVWSRADGWWGRRRDPASWLVHHTFLGSNPKNK